MKLFLIEYQDPNTGKLKEPYLVGESGLYDFAKYFTAYIDENFKEDLIVDVLENEYGYTITEINNTYDILNMFDMLKMQYMNH